VARRDRRGRFVKGTSGNPAGRPPGILNEATRTAAVLLGGEAGALTRKAIELALAGDIMALRLCIDRIIAPQRELPAAFEMPAIGEAADLDRAMTALGRAAASGTVTPTAAAALAEIIEAHARVIETTARIEAERVAVRHAQIGLRLDLRICVVIAHRLRDFAAVADPGIVERCAEMRRIGEAAWNMLAAIPDTRELTEADRAFIIAHPLPLDRTAHPLGAAMRRAWEGFFAYWNRPEMRARLACGRAEGVGGTAFGEYGNPA
jgi:hypothetical protein